VRKSDVITLPSRLVQQLPLPLLFNQKQVNMNIQEKRNSKGYFTVFTTKEGTKFSRRRT